MKKILAAVFAAMVFVAPAAQADITICNKTSRDLGIAVAARVTVPYSRWEVNGWWNLEPGECATPYTGDYSGEKIYYYGRFVNEGRDWEEDEDWFPVCVPADGSEFTRAGSSEFIQNCSGGWIKKNFYESYSSKKHRQINLVGR